MRYKLLGNSGVRVSELALGTMTFGDKNDDGVCDKKTSRALFDTFLEVGGNFIDTANGYTGGTSESHLGEFIASTNERERFVVATKYSGNMRPGDPNGGGRLKWPAYSTRADELINFKNAGPAIEKTPNVAALDAIAAGYH